MKIFRVTYGSRVNGPGVRNVLHTQGCSVKCSGCFNVHTWDPNKGDDFSPSTVVDMLLANGPVDGVTISGGEPTDQWSDIKKVLKGVREGGQSVVLFTGRTKEQLIDLGYWDDMELLTDIVVAGPYDRSKPLEGEPLRGSSNQVVHYHGEYSAKDLSPIPEVEVHIDGDNVTIAGFPTKELRTTLLKEIRG